MGEEDTTIRVRRSTWRELHERKDPGKSMDDVLQDLIDNAAGDGSAVAES